MICRGRVDWGNKVDKVDKIDKIGKIGKIGKIHKFDIDLDDTTSVDNYFDDNDYDSDSDVDGIIQFTRV